MGNGLNYNFFSADDIMEQRKILSGDEAVAYAALACGVTLGSGYPGTPSTEVLETLASIGGPAEWSPNEKVALEVGAGVAVAGGRSLVTMKHVGVNVAADPLFTLTYMGVNGALVLLTADDPGMGSSQNEQDNRNYAKFAMMPMLEPSDSQEAYDFAIRAFKLSEEFRVPVMFRMTTRVCHSRGPVTLLAENEPRKIGNYIRDVKTKVMIPAYAKKAHVRLVKSMADLAAYNEAHAELREVSGAPAELGVITSGVAYQHVKEAAPDAAVLKLGMTWPLPMDAIRDFAAQCKRVIVVEEGSRFLEENILAAGIGIERKDEIFEYGELNVARVKKLLAHDSSPDAVGAPGRPPALCPGCPHRKTYEVLRDMGCIVAGDIGCYTLGVLPPFEALDCSICMGASIGAGLGMRHSLPEEQARKVVSVIGDSTFLHSGITGILEMGYNKPATGHVVLILDNSTTAMTGLQEHAATGVHLDKSDAPKVSLEALCKAAGADNVDVVDQVREQEAFRALLEQRLASNDVSVIIARNPCILQLKKLAKQRTREEKQS